MTYHEESQSSRTTRSYFNEYDEVDIATHFEIVRKHPVNNTQGRKGQLDDYIKSQSQRNKTNIRNKKAQNQLYQRNIMLKNWKKERYDKIDGKENIGGETELQNKIQEKLRKRHQNVNSLNQSSFIPVANGTTLNILDVWPENAPGEWVL